MEIDPPTFLQSAGTPTPPGVETNSRSSLDVFPRKRPLHQDDPFFQEGAYEYKAAWLRLEDADAYIPDLNEPEDNTHRTVAQACHYGSCHGEKTFSSAAMYEHHFDTNHRHICQTCKKAFPGEKWLVLHIREVHDVLVRIQRERGERTKRRMHLIDKHQYPKHFNFSVVVTGVTSSAERTASIQKQNAREARKQGQQKPNQHQQQQHHAKDHEMVDEHSMEVEHSTFPTQDPRTFNSSRGKSATPDPGTLTPAIAAPRTVKKNAFQQYRSQDTKPKPSPRRLSIIRGHTDMDMDAPSTPSASGPTSVVSTGASSQLDFDMDQLQISMSRLMVPRSVAMKMTAKPRTPNNNNNTPTLATTTNNNNETLG
ncbi:hypothetical protein BG015_002314 [Linnemannia schmuckeri]|uniref:C2H2-type domain-containing protein n=1 Tax=Linnemannia schmuckeri TaxID=64567 RepID=A0A9P5RP66_9FUNG|nr:hypothetical protein BG015_002314 [Linnemannia schmuckeri]